MTDTPKSKNFLTRLFGDEAESVEVEKQKERKTLINAAASFHDLKVEDVMVPRAEIIAVAEDLQLADLVRSFIKAGHSRLPVYKENLDEPLGFVHVKDVLKALDFDAPGRGTKTFAKQKLVGDILRPVLFVPPSMGADALLRKMQAARAHMALVVDEYGGTDGLVTLEDLIEPIVGDIEDEHDGEEPGIIAKTNAKGQTYWDVDGRVDIDDFEKACGFEIATPEQDEEVDTLGGLVFSLVGRVPQRGEVISHPMGHELEILDADARRVKRVRLKRKAV